LILIEEPYFNEPAYEASRGTSEGQRNCRVYNETLRLATARHALLTPARAALQRGGGGGGGGAFDDVIARHLTLQRHRLARQLRGWTRDASAANRRKFERVARELDAVIAQLSCDE
jgi:baculoviral IAP repeat-containing protein 6